MPLKIKSVIESYQQTNMAEKYMYMVCMSVGTWQQKLLGACLLRTDIAMTNYILHLKNKV